MLKLSRKVCTLTSPIMQMRRHRGILQLPQGHTVGRLFQIENSVASLWVLVKLCYFSQCDKEWKLLGEFLA